MIMTPRKRFFIGGCGAIVPVVVTIMAIDLGASINALFSNGSAISIGNIIGFMIQYSLLFALGGFIAYLHTSEEVPFKLFEIGIAGPALVTSMVAAQAIAAPATEPGPSTESAWNMSIIGNAHADSFAPTEPLVVAGFWADIKEGVTGQAYRKIRDKEQKVTPPPVKPPRQTTQQDKPPQSASVQSTVEPQPQIVAPEPAQPVVQPPTSKPPMVKAPTQTAPEPAPQSTVMPQSVLQSIPDTVRPQSAQPPSQPTMTYNLPQAPAYPPMYYQQTMPSYGYPQQQAQPYYSPYSTYGVPPARSYQQPYYSVPVR